VLQVANWHQFSIHRHHRHVVPHISLGEWDWRTIEPQWSAAEKNVVTKFRNQDSQQYQKQNAYERRAFAYGDPGPNRCPQNVAHCHGNSEPVKDFSDRDEKKQSGGIGCQIDDLCTC
jgi:hypothetical protein